MDNWTIRSNLDAVVFALPMVAMLFLAYFRLDELIAAPKRRGPSRRHSMTLVGDRLVGCDPDGRPWQRQRPLQRPANRP